MPDYPSSNVSEGPLKISKNTERKLAAALSNASIESIETAKVQVAQGSNDAEFFDFEPEAPLFDGSFDHQVFLDVLFSRNQEDVINQLASIGIADPAEQQEIVRALNLFSPDLARLTARAISVEMASLEQPHDHDDEAEEASNHNY